MSQQQLSRQYQALDKVVTALKTESKQELKTSPKWDVLLACIKSFPPTQQKTLLEFTQCQDRARVLAQLSNACWCGVTVLHNYSQFDEQQDLL